MARTLILGLILLLGVPFPLFAGEITGVGVGKKTQDEIEIQITGEHGAFQGVGLRSPARFVIDLQGAHLSESVPGTINVEGPIVSAIKTVRQGNDVRVVLESADSTRLFHCTMNDKEGKIVVKCWMPKEAASASADAAMHEIGHATTPVLRQKELSDIFGWSTTIEDKQEDKETKKLSKYTGEKITLDFYKTDLHNVFRLFAEMSGKNIIIDDQVKGELTLALKEVPWDSAMDLIMDLKGLIKEEKLGTYIIKPAPAKTTTGKGELVIKKFSEEILQPARLLKEDKENQSRAQDMITKANNLEASGEKEKALELYEAAYAIWKDNLDLIVKAAYLHYTMGHFARSYFFAGQALKQNPRHSEAALYAALSAARMGKSEDARQLFEVATNARPNIPETYYNYGLFLRQHEDYDEALRIYQRYEQSFGPSLEVRLAVAGIYEAQGKTMQAYDKYREINDSGFSMDKKTKQIVQQKIMTLCNQGEY